VGVQKVRWERRAAGEYTFFYGKGNENHELGTGFFVHMRIIAAKKVELVSDKKKSKCYPRNRPWRPVGL
jgi:hypothetical protein